MCTQIGKTNIFEIVILPKIIHRFNAISIKIPMVFIIELESVQFSCSVVSNSSQPHGLQHSRSLSITNSQSLLKLMSIQLVMSSNHPILCHPLLILPSIISSIRVFFNGITWPKYWTFSFSINPSNEYSGLISFMIDLFDFLTDWRREWQTTSVFLPWEPNKQYEKAKRTRIN